MHKADTALINQQALAERIRELGLKQYVLARRIGVEPMTVNRWLTGKVKRISRDNLGRICELLKLPEQQLTFRDEADVKATQVEQTAAAGLLIEQATREMFIYGDRLELYEALLKATMHANLPLETLNRMYRELMIVAARQDKLDDARAYAVTVLDYSQRCGDTGGEISSRVVSATLDAATGSFAKARQSLEEAASLAESCGELASYARALLNLANLLQFTGEMEKATRALNRAIEIFEGLGQGEALQHACSIGHNIALQSSQPELSLRIFLRGLELYPQERSERSAIQDRMCLALSYSACGDSRLAREQLEQGLARLDRLEVRGNDARLTAARALRLLGRFGEARKLARESLSEDQAPMGYLYAFVHEELAAIAACAGEGTEAARERAEANRIYRDYGIARRVSADPRHSPPGVFPPTRLRLRVPELL